MALPYQLTEVDTIDFPVLTSEARNFVRPSSPGGPPADERLRALRLMGDDISRAEPRSSFRESLSELARWIGHALRVAMWANPVTEQSLQVDPAGLRTLIRKSRLAILTTRDREGRLHTRPMSPTRRLFDGEIWFATPEADPIIDHVRARAPVQVTYLDGANNRSLVLNGVARVCRRTAKGVSLPKWVVRRRQLDSVTYIRVNVMSADVWQ